MANLCMYIWLNEVKKLAFLIGGMSDHMLACTFVHRIAGNIKQTLYVLSRMDMLSIDQLFAQVIMRDEE